MRGNGGGPQQKMNANTYKIVLLLRKEYLGGNVRAYLKKWAEEELVPKLYGPFDCEVDFVK